MPGVFDMSKVIRVKGPKDLMIQGRRSLSSCQKHDFKGICIEAIPRFYPSKGEKASSIRSSTKSAYLSRVPIFPPIGIYPPTRRLILMVIEISSNLGKNLDEGGGSVS